MHKDFLAALDNFREEYGKPMVLTCGYRCPEHNEAVGGRPNSAHLSGQAVDVADADGDLKAYCTEEVLAKHDLYMEEPSATVGWCHLQSRPTANRVFIP